MTAGVPVGVDPRVSLGVGGKMKPGDPAGVGAGGGGGTTGTVGCGEAVGVGVAVGMAVRVGLAVRVAVGVGVDVGVVVGGAGANAGAKAGTYAQGCALEGATMPASTKHSHKCSDSIVLMCSCFVTANKAVRICKCKHACAGATVSE